MPRHLPESDEGKRMALLLSRQGSLRGADVRRKVSVEYFRAGLSRIERNQPPQNFTTVISRHPDGRDLGGRLLDIKISGTPDARASIRQVHRPLRVTSQ